MRVGGFDPTLSAISKNNFNINQSSQIAYDPGCPGERTAPATRVPFPRRAEVSASMGQGMPISSPRRMVIAPSWGQSQICRF